MAAAVASLGSLTLFPAQGGDWLWPLLGICFSLSNIAYSLVALAFPVALSGRANTALNLMAFAGAFGLQWGFGILVDVLQTSGWAAEGAFRVALATLFAGQVAALLWLLASRRRR
jgi:hypothetical protein